jgi:uncharacterized repeat protein (TIGR02543 family)
VPADAAASFGLASPTLTGDGSSALTLTFSPTAGIVGGYDQPQTVVVKARTDQNTNDESASISVSLPSVAVTVPVSVTSTDTDTQAIVVVPAGDGKCVVGGTGGVNYTCTLFEHKQAASMMIDGTLPTVHLKLPPHVTISGTAPSETINTVSASSAKVTVSPASLTFSSTSGVIGGWDYPFTSISLASVPDNDALDENVIVTLSTTLTGGPWQAPPIQIRVLVDDLDTFALGVAVTGGGTVSDTAPATGIAICGATSGTCTASYGSGATSTVVTLTETTPTGWQFAGWGGDCTGSAATTTVTMSQARNCTATFNPILTVTTTGTGSGTVTSDSGGIACTSGSTDNCTHAFSAGASVILTATPAGTSTFDSWSGVGCPTTNPGTVVVNGPLTCTATFD